MQQRLNSLSDTKFRPMFFSLSNNLFDKTLSLKSLLTTFKNPNVSSISHIALIKSLAVSKTLTFSAVSLV